MKKQKDKNKFLNSGFFIFKNAVKINKIELILKHSKIIFLKVNIKKYSNIKIEHYMKKYHFFNMLKKNDPIFFFKII